MSEFSNDQPKESTVGVSDEIDLKELFLVVWSGRWLIAALTTMAAVCSVTIALVLPKMYTANALLAPAEQSGGGMSALMQQYGGLASLAGVSLPGGEDGSRAQLGIQLMKSRGFIGDFVLRRGILPELMAVESWNEISGELVFDSKLYDATSGTWVRDVRPPKSVAPSKQEAHKAFSELLTVTQDKQTGYVTVSLQHRSPIVAAQWVGWLIKDINEEVRSKDVREANKSISYLKEQVANTSLADLQAVFFDLIQSQTETVMLAEVREEYVFKTIDPAVVPEDSSEPNRALICVFGTFLGWGFGVILVVFRHYILREASR